MDHYWDRSHTKLCVFYQEYPPFEHYSGMVGGFRLSRSLRCVEKEFHFDVCQPSMGPVPCHKICLQHDVIQRERKETGQQTLWDLIVLFKGFPSTLLITQKFTSFHGCTNRQGRCNINPFHLDCQFCTIICSLFNQSTIHPMFFSGYSAIRIKLIYSIEKTYFILFFFTRIFEHVLMKEIPRFQHFKSSAVRTIAIFIRKDSETATQPTAPWISDWLVRCIAICEGTLLRHIQLHNYVENRTRAYVTAWNEIARLYSRLIGLEFSNCK